MASIVPAFLAELGDRLSPGQHARCRQILAGELARQERWRERPQTFRHGDAHWWGFLHPGDPAAGTTRLLDWGSWRIGPGTIWWPMLECALAAFENLDCAALLAG